MKISSKAIIKQNEKTLSTLPKTLSVLSVFFVKNQINKELYLQPNKNHFIIYLPR